MLACERLKILFPAGAQAPYLSSLLKDGGVSYLVFTSNLIHPDFNITQPSLTSDSPCCSFTHLTYGYS